MEFSMIKRNIVLVVLLLLFASLFLNFNFREGTSSVAVDFSKECEIKRNEYDQQLARKEFWNASFAMKKCAQDLNNADYKQLADSAEVKARISDINDKTKNPTTRINQIEVLEKFFPNESKQFTTLKSTLIAENARSVASEAKAVKAKKRSEGVSIGMSRADVLASSWGKPQSVNTTTNAYGVREQWVYGDRNYLYFKDGVLESIQH
jgi:hypothetical protein